MRVSLPVEVVHGVTGVAGDLVETLSSAHRLLNGILVIQNLVIWRRRDSELTRESDEKDDKTRS